MGTSKNARETRGAREDARRNGYHFYRHFNFSTICFNRVEETTL